MIQQQRKHIKLTLHKAVQQVNIMLHWHGQGIAALIQPVVISSKGKCTEQSLEHQGDTKLHHASFDNELAYIQPLQWSKFLTPRTITMLDLATINEYEMRTLRSNGCKRSIEPTFLKTFINGVSILPQSIICCTQTAICLWIIWVNL